MSNDDYVKYIGEVGFNYSVNISLQHKYVFVETPKVASSTIKSILNNLELGVIGIKRFPCVIHDRTQFPLLSPKQVGNFDDFIKRSDLVKFCFVRNPYDRVLSVYLDKIKAKRENNTVEKKKILIQLGYDDLNADVEISFKEFVEIIVQQPIKFMDPHWRVQYYQTMQNFINYDFIGKLENFNDDFEKILNKIITKDVYEKYLVSETRHATNAKKKKVEYYNDELKSLIYCKYKKDFDFFGYNSELNGDFLNCKKNSPDCLNVGDMQKINEILFSEIDSDKKDVFIAKLQKEIQFLKSSKFFKLRNIYLKTKLIIKNRFSQKI